MYIHMEGDRGKFNKWLIKKVSLAFWFKTWCNPFISLLLQSFKTFCGVFFTTCQDHPQILMERHGAHHGVFCPNLRKLLSRMWYLTTFKYFFKSDPRGLYHNITVCASACIETFTNVTPWNKTQKGIVVL